MSRLPGRLIFPPIAWLKWFLSRILFVHKTKQRLPPQKILILHSMLLGDSILLFSLISKIRLKYPDAIVYVTVAMPLFKLYEKADAKIRPLLFRPKSFLSQWEIFRTGPYDLTILPSENNYSILARAAGSRRIIGFAGDQPSWKNWLLDERVLLPNAPAALGDIMQLLIPGGHTGPFNYDWKIQKCRLNLIIPEGTIVCHLTSSVDSKEWPNEKWKELAGRLSDRGFGVLWSVGPGEEGRVKLVDESDTFQTIALPFLETFHVLKKAMALVTVDTSMVHLARVAGTPTVTIYGPTHPNLFGSGVFWGSTESQDVFHEGIPCRDDGKIFRRNLDWVEICTRSRSQCGNAFCIDEIGVDEVEAAIYRLKGVSHV